MSKLFTLITDSGKDHFTVGRLKGRIYSNCPEAQIVDITHQIQHFNIVDAAFQLGASYASFPKGSVHIMHVYTYYDDPSTWIAFSREGQFFVGPNNGIFSLMFEDLGSDIYEIGTSAQSDWSGFQMAEAAVDLFRDDPWEGYTICEDVDRRIKLQPVISAKEIRGTIIQIDEFHNAITNIDLATFEKVRNGRQFALYFKRFDPITYLSDHYSEVEIGETLCRFNSLGYLEIAINLGKAASTLGLKMNDTIQIEFF
jgi:hypothetical protein